jgi:hypothetical protein
MVPPMGAAGLMPSAAVSAPLGPKQDIGEEGGWDLYLIGAKMASARPAAASLIDAVHILHESTAWALAVVPSGRQDELVMPHLGAGQSEQSEQSPLLSRENGTGVVKEVEQLGEFHWKKRYYWDGSWGGTQVHRAAVVC